MKGKAYRILVRKYEVRDHLGDLAMDRLVI
jgi:hypothetical protein